MHEFHCIGYESFSTALEVILKANIIQKQAFTAWFNPKGRWFEVNAFKGAGYYCLICGHLNSHTYLPIYSESECFHDNNIKAKFLLKKIQLLSLGENKQTKKMHKGKDFFHTDFIPR